MKKQLWIGLGLSVVFLYLAFRQLEWSLVLKTILNADLAVMLLALPFIIFSHALRAFRWRHIIGTEESPGLNSLFGALMIGFMALNLLPFRLGELIRAYVLGRRENMSASGVFATVVVERVFDGLMVLFLLLLVMIFLPFDLAPEAKVYIRALAGLALAVFVAALVGLYLIRQKPEIVVRLIRFFFGFAPKLAVFFERATLAFVRGLGSLGNPRAILVVTGYSLLVWLAAAAYYWVIMFGFDYLGPTSLGTQVGPVGSLFVLTAVALGIAAPSSPGAAGTFELACIMALAALGIDRQLAGSYALAAHAVQFVAVTIIGLIYLYFFNFSFAEIRSGARSLKKA